MTFVANSRDFFLPSPLGLPRNICQPNVTCAFVRGADSWYVSGAVLNSYPLHLGACIVAQQNIQATGTRHTLDTFKRSSKIIAKIVDWRQSFCIYAVRLSATISHQTLAQNMPKWDKTHIIIKSKVKSAPTCYRAPRWPDPEFLPKIPKKYPPARNSGTPR